MHALQIVAGTRAYERIRRHHFQLKDIRALLGASGGPKWFVLAHLDRYLSSQVLPRLEQPVHLIGSSIGAWRMACHAQADASSALKRLETEYLHQTFAPGARSADITAQCRTLLEQVFTHGFDPLPERPLHLVTARCKGPAASTGRFTLAAGFGLVGLTNLLARKQLRWFFDRHLFETHPGSMPVTRYNDFRTRTSQLSADNWQAAMMASAAIPMVLDPVHQISGATPGCYRDGGMVDYHFDLPLDTPDGIVLYPHFTPDLKPGWFDKRLPWRTISEEHYQDVLMLVPTREFIAQLPNGRIPDRRDFRRMRDAERLTSWRQAVQQGERLADEFHEWLAGGASLARVQKLSTWQG